MKPFVEYILQNWDIRSLEAINTILDKLDISYEILKNEYTDANSVFEGLIKYFSIVFELRDGTYRIEHYEDSNTGKNLLLDLDEKNNLSKTYIPSLKSNYTTRPSYKIKGLISKTKSERITGEKLNLVLDGDMGYEPESKGNYENVLPETNDKIGNKTNLSKSIGSKMNDKRNQINNTFIGNKMNEELTKNFEKKKIMKQLRKI